MEKQIISKLLRWYAKSKRDLPWRLLQENNSSIVAFARFKVGEGIEVEVKDFAAEVAEQLQQ